MIKDIDELAKRMASYRIPEEYLQAEAGKGILGGLLGSLLGSKPKLGTNARPYGLRGFGGPAPTDLLDIMEHNSEPSFESVFFEYVNRSMDNGEYSKYSEIYKKAGISKSTFSKISSGTVPKRENVLRLALVLHLNMAEAKRLLHAGGYEFKVANKFDRFVCFFIEEWEKGKKYDYDLLNLWCDQLVGVALVGEK